MKPSIGIAIPVLDGARFLEACLASVRAVTVPVEVVVQDGGSRDSSLEIAQRMVGADPRFTIVSERDTGQSDALNRAWSRMIDRHPFMSWVNADDVLHPHGLAQALDLATRRHDAAVVYGSFLVVDEHGMVREFIRRPPRLRRADLLYVDSLVPGVAAVCRTSAIRRVGMFDATLHFALDHDLFLRLAQVGKMYGVPQPTFSFRWHRDSKTAGSEWAKSRAEALEVSEKHRRLRGAPADAMSIMLRARYRAMKALGSRLPHERFGDQQVHLQR